MPISARGNKRAPTLPAARGSLPPEGAGPPWGGPAAGRTAFRGFTLLELLVVVAIIAFATAGVSFALRDTESVQLEREAQRLSALLESARVQSRTTGLPVRWYAVQGGFRFDGLPPGAKPETGWLSASTQVQGSVTLVLGPDPIIGPQAVVLTSSTQPDRSLRVATDGLRPFAVSRAATP
jgi:general secretion pathway protein H